MSIAYIRHQGHKYRVQVSGFGGSGPAALKAVFPAGVSDERQRELIREGEFLNDDGTLLEGRAAQRVRDRLLGTYDNLRQRRRFGDSAADGPRRMLIPGLWPWGHIPVLGGNPKAGKTTVVADLARALVIPGYRFLGCFDPVVEVHYWNDGPATDHDHDRERGVVLINAETPREDMEAAIGAGIDEDAAELHVDGGLVTRYLYVEHLEEQGGAGVFDVTVSSLYDHWAHLLAECFECDGSDDRAPFAVIVDGVTAILGNDTSRYGQWYAAFRALMREIDVPNALAVAHHTLSGAHLMGGVEAQAGADGLWTYSSDYADDPRSARRFSVRPRMGGVVIPPALVTLDPEGRPVMGPGRAVSETAARPSEAGEAASPFEAAVLALLDSEGGWTPTARLRTTEGGSGNLSRDLRAMVTRRVIEYNGQRGPQSAYRLPRG